jgi:hypothetical protein
MQGRTIYSAEGQEHMLPLALSSDPLPQVPTSHVRPFDVTGPYDVDVRKAVAISLIIDELVRVIPTESNVPLIVSSVYDVPVSWAMKFVHAVHCVDGVIPVTKLSE